MCSMRWFLLKSCIFGVYISITEANVSLKTSDGKTTYLIDSTVELVCTITSYNNEMTWYVDNVPYADCFLGTCGPSPNKPYTFQYTFDETAGVFNLTISSVNFSHANLTFVCDDGTQRDTISFNVTTVPNKDNGDNDDSTRSTGAKVGYGFAGVCGFGLVCIVIYLLVKNLQPKFTWIELKDRAISLEWTDSLNCCGKWLFEYHVACYPKQPQGRNFIREKSTKKRYCKLENLDPMVIYEIRFCRTLCCCRCFATTRSVITRKSGMPNDQGYRAKPTKVEIWWTQPDCITTLQLKYKVTCNEEVKLEITGQIRSTITGLMPNQTYKIEVFAIDNGTNSLLFAEKIKTTPLQVCLGEFCYKPGQSCVECEITWTVKDFDIQEHLNESDNFYFIVKWCIGRQEVDKRETIRASRYTIPKLYPNRSYTVYVYPVYHSVTFEPEKIELTTPYKPTQLKPTAVKSTVIDVTWEKPDYTKGQRLQYQVFCNEAEVEKTYLTLSKIKNLVPGQTYKIMIFTIINGIKSLPSVKEIPTPPLKVSLKVDGYKPEEESCVKCTITCTVKDFDRPKPFNKPDDEFLYNVELYSGNQLVHTNKEITDSSYTIPDIYPNRSYTVDVYAVYHSITLTPPGKIQLTPYKPTILKCTAKSTKIELEWVRPQYTGNQPLKYEVTCNKVRVNTTSETSYKIENLEPCQQYDIEIFTIIHRMKSLPLQQTIRTQPLKVSLEDVCYKPGQSCVECEITWAIEDFDIQEHLNESDNFYFKVKWCLENQAVGEEEIRGSSFTIPELFPDRSYSVYVYPVYHSVTFGPAMIELTAPYKPPKLKYTAKSTQIELEWERPQYTGNKSLTYEVTCDKVLVNTTSKTSYKIENLKPCQQYDIEILTIIHRMKSLPLQETIRTQPLKPKALPPIESNQNH